MIDPKILDDMAKRLAALVPSSVQTLQQDLEKNFRATLQAGLQKMDLVTREEFEVQAALLARTRDKLDQLALKVEQLEAKQGVESDN